MKKIGLKATLAISGLSLLTVGVAVDANVFNFSNFGLRLSRASGEPSYIVLNNSNAPTLSAGSATQVDEKGVTWEYSDCASYASGHVAINHQGYFGVISSTAYGYTGISKITANFSSSEGDELWLLKSIDGVEWHEDCILTSGTGVTTPLNWRYVRFYNYSKNNNAINIASIRIEYTCTGGDTASEDIDAAKSDKVISTTYLSYEDETTDVSPWGNSTHAVNFTKTPGGNDNFSVYALDRTYTLEEIRNKKVEFDLNTSRSTWKPSVELIYNDGTNLTLVGEKTDINKDKTVRTHYKITKTSGDWWHIEVPVSALAPTICDPAYGNRPYSLSLQVNAIRLGNGNTIVDNVRIGSTPSELGIFNSWASSPVNSYYWLKVSWVGYLDLTDPSNVSITFSDNQAITRVQSDKSPFIIQGLITGTYTVTVVVKSGYNRLPHTMQTQLTIS